MFTTELMDEMTYYFFEAQWEDLNSTLADDTLIPEDWMTR